MRLIDAEEVIKAVDKHTFETKDGLCLDDDISIILEDVPTVEERKRGKWIHYDTENEKYEDIRCSECRKMFTVDSDRFCDIGFIAEDLDFCPNCGAI